MPEIRRLTAADAERALPDLIALLRDCIEGGASIGFVLPLDDAELDTYWRDVIASVEAGNRLLWGAFDDAGRLIGGVQLEPSGKANGAHRAEVQKLLVHRDARRQGVAVMLMTALEAEARALGRSLLVLDTRTGDHAEPLYRKLGYQTAGVIPDFAISPDRATLEGTTVMYKRLMGA
jgi:hypothetical protein